MLVFSGPVFAGSWRKISVLVGSVLEGIELLFQRQHFHLCLSRIGWVDPHVCVRFRVVRNINTNTPTQLGSFQPLLPKGPAPWQSGRNDAGGCLVRCIKDLAMFCAIENLMGPVLIVVLTEPARDC